jgi:hypothetical protein
MDVQTTTTTTTPTAPSATTTTEKATWPKIDIPAILKTVWKTEHTLGVACMFLGKWLPTQAAIFPQYGQALETFGGLFEGFGAAILLYSPSPKQLERPA